MIDKTTGHGGIDPDGALACAEQGQVLVVTIGCSSRWAITPHQVNIQLDGVAPGLRGQLRLPGLIKPLPPWH